MRAKCASGPDTQTQISASAASGRLAEVSPFANSAADQQVNNQSLHPELLVSLSLAAKANIRLALPSRDSRRAPC